MSRSSNLRPRIGVVSIVRSLSVLAAATRVASTVAAWVDTVTVSATPDSFIVGFTRTASPMVTRTFSCTTVAKFWRVNVSV